MLLLCCGVFFYVCTAPRSEPSNITGTALNSTHIYLTWDPPPPEDINGVIREYRINVTEGETGNLLQYTTNPDTRELVVGRLHPYYTYHCTVGAYTVEVGPHTAITVRTDEAGEDNSIRRCICDHVSRSLVNLFGMLMQNASINFCKLPSCLIIDLRPAK